MNQRLPEAVQLLTREVVLELSEQATENLFDMQSLEELLEEDSPELPAETAWCLGLAVTEGHSCTRRNAEDALQGMVEKPFAYKGNTYAAHLTEAVRCRIKRRLATRAAARSAGLRLFETWADSNLRVQQINMHNTYTSRNTAEMEAYTRLLDVQLEACEARYEQALAINVRLHQRLSELNCE